MKHVEKIDVRSRHSGFRFLKRMTNKLLRRLGKKDPEDAPRRVRDVTRGWVS